MCRHPAILAPASGFEVPNSSRRAIRPGISVSAISISFRPNSASPRSATLKSATGFVVTIFIEGLKVNWLRAGSARTVSACANPILLCDRCFEGFDAVGALPAERFQIVLATEMSVVCRLAVDWPKQIELLNNRGRLEIKDFADGLLNF